MIKIIKTIQIQNLIYFKKKRQNKRFEQKK